VKHPFQHGAHHHTDRTLQYKRFESLTEQHPCRLPKPQRFPSYVEATSYHKSRNNHKLKR
jgi:hypothetical protein